MTFAQINAGHLAFDRDARRIARTRTALSEAVTAALLAEDAFRCVIDAQPGVVTDAQWDSAEQAQADTRGRLAETLADLGLSVAQIKRMGEVL